MATAHICINPKDKSQEIATCFYSSPVGKLRISATSKGICEISVSSSPRPAGESLPAGQAGVREAGVRGHPHLKICLQQLDEYFARKRESFDFPLDIHGTEFQIKVWRALQKIPHGHTLSYSDIAQKIRNPKAVRAVGLANNKNKIAIVIPCHRVIGKDGSLTGYAGGLNRKKWLIKHEKEFASFPGFFPTIL